VPSINRHSIPAARIACQKNIPNNATTTMRRIRPRVPARKVLSWEVSRPGSLMRNYSVARQRAKTSPDIDEDFLNRPLAADAGRRIAARRAACRALAHRNSPAEIAPRVGSAGAISAARRTIVIGLAPALIAEPAAATCINASREGFTPRQPALTGNGGE
jgi:hypothetical protein